MTQNYPARECTNSMTREAFLHTRDMCYFLSAQIWQKKTDNEISHLTENASYVTHQGKKSSTLQKDIKPNL